MTLRFRRRASLLVDPEGALPAISSQSTLGTDTATWLPQRDLLGSAPDAAEFVVEIENDGIASLRFGDDEYGQQPEPGTLSTRPIASATAAPATSAGKRWRTS